MTIDGLEKCVEGNNFINDFGVLTDDGWAFLDMAREVIALFRAIDHDATHINDGSDPMGGWLGPDDDDHVWCAFQNLKKKLESK